MTGVEHPDADRLRRFLRGLLEEEDAGGLLSHVESCGHCLDLAEKIWADESPLGEGREAPLLDEATSDRLEKGLFRRIHFTRLLEDVTVFGVRGLLFVPLKLLDPLQDFFSRTNDRSFLTISSTFHSLFKVLFTFPSQYFYAIGVPIIFSFR